MTIKTFGTVSGPQALAKEIVSVTVDEATPFEDVLDCTFFPSDKDTKVVASVENFAGVGDITFEVTGVQKADGSGLEDSTPVSAVLSANTPYSELLLALPMKKWPYAKLNISAAAGVSGDVKLFIVGKNF